MAKPERCFRGLTGPGRLLSSTNIAKGPAMANGKHRFLLPFAEPPACPVFRCVACRCDKKCRSCVSSPGLFVENAACVCCGIVYFLIFRGAGLACRLRMRRFRAGRFCFFRLNLFQSASYSFFLQRQSSERLPFFPCPARRGSGSLSDGLIVYDTPF